MNDVLQSRKSTLRKQLKTIRHDLGDTRRGEFSRSITEKVLELPEIHDAGTVFIYISAGDELDTHGLINQFLRDGKRLAVPKILDRETMIAVEFADWEQLKPAQLGILAPVSNEPFSGEFDVIVTPGLGFTATGYRIGYGAGYYDRWFEGHPGGYRIAPAFDCQIVAELPLDEYDRPVHRIVTETRDLILGAGG